MFLIVYQRVKHNQVQQRTNIMVKGVVVLPVSPKDMKILEGRQEEYVKSPEI